ncbi:P-loop NTPase [Parvularcula sp. ZS-1/3]|uniref:Iron-sulfur cluster carrier protein n=1 Tax=Parvularcula mediterranea TaxID=2732508 RepID=A0A7Y3RJU2_9PROT|nr:P-loop NTPase [Parvularcula mediterranea]NNU15407.1 P-loop NTPase [Parvularcula mediterranea]
MMRRFKEAARKGRAEAQIRRILDEKGLAGDVGIRLLEDRMTATVVLKGAPDQGDEALEKALAQGSGIERVTLVRTEHGGAAPSPAPAPQAPPAPKGGHSDPLQLGTKPAQRPEPTRPEGVRRVVAVASGKGGVGKSTVAANLALGLASQGLKVGLLDLDIHGPSLPVLFPVAEKLKSEDGKIIPAEAEGLKLVSLGYMVDERQAVAWRGPMVMNAARQLIDDTGWGELDVLVVDTPPGTGDAHLSLVQRMKLDAALLVATPSPLATADVRRGAQLFERVGAPVVGIVLNMTGGPLGDDLEPALLDDLDLDILDRLPMALDTARTPLRSGQAVPLPGATEKVTSLLGDVAGDSGEAAG